MARILFVDDDAVSVARHATTLKARGHAISTATTVAAAVAAVRRDEPDVVVLEAMLDGGLAGFGLARRFAREYPELPLIMVTRADEFLTAEDRARQDRDGGWIPVERYLAKPVMPDVLAYEVDHLLDRAA
jgi:DNA-binding response OmpR family regulator